MAASSPAAARAALLRLAYSACSATSSRPLPASAALAARAAVRCLAHDAAAAPSTSSSSASPSSSSAYPSASAAASRVPTRWREDRAAGAARSPATATVGVPSSSALSASATADSGVTTRGPVHKDADDAASSPRTHTVAVLPAVIRGLARKAATAASSLTSSGIWSGFTCGQRQLSTSAWANNMGSYPQPKSVQFLISLLNGMVLTKEEELIFRKAFNDKFSHFKVGDILNHLESEKFTFEEYCFLLRIVYSKLGPNRELAELVLKEAINPSCSDEEIMNNPVLARVETKIDLLSNKFEEGTGKILDSVQVANKSEWGSITVLGRKLDMTKLEYIKRVIEHFMGM